MRILIMGLPGSSKTTLTEELKRQLARAGKTYVHFNADEVRKKYNDWDFSEAGRIRQSHRMRELADGYPELDYAICDFVAPLEEMRDAFAADWTIWMDTINSSIYEDTNQIFVKPSKYDIRITEFESEYWANFIVEYITGKMS
jgi:adenylylsulfate kinase